MDKLEQKGLLSDCSFIFTYGSTTSDVKYIANINIGIVTNELKIHSMKKWKPVINYILRKGKSMPLFLTEKEFLNSIDAFPLEFMDMKQRHFKLYGRDMFDEIDIDPLTLRTELESELRAKLVRLREIYFAPHTRSLIRNIVFKTLSSLNLLLKAVIFVEYSSHKEKYINLFGTGSDKEALTAISSLPAEKVFEFLSLHMNLALGHIKSAYDYKYSNIKFDMDDKTFLEIIREWFLLVNYIDGV